ncbi:MAG TPA: cytochrome c oxidase subunit 3, partial [Acidimicrobiales bacterium]
MAATQSPVTPIGLAPVAPPARPRVLLVGTCLAIAAVIMTFVGLLGIYTTTRSAALAHGGTWLPTGVAIPLTPGTMSLFTLILSVITMWWAADAVGRNDRQGAFVALGLTIMFGVCVINATSFLLIQSKLTINTTPGVLIYTIVGAHLALLVSGLIYAAVMTFRTLGGNYNHRDREGVVSAAFFWYAVVAVYVA